MRQAVVIVNDLLNEITLQHKVKEIETVPKTTYLGIDLFSRKGPKEQIYVGVNKLTGELRRLAQLLKPLRYRLPHNIYCTT